MKVEVEVVSREFIKPSSPTPKHLHNYQLSSLDQISPPIYVPQIFFYNYKSSPNYAYPAGNAEMPRRLKTSLSETLTRFYPLAGRLDNVDAMSVKCNDEGVLFVEARAKSRLTEGIVDDPNLGDHNIFLPLNYHRDHILLAIQANFFDCGGLAIGVCLSHKIADASSTIMFMTSWATTSNHDQMSIINPTFESAKLFPPRGISRGLEIKEHNIVAKRFVFDHSMVESLRAKYSTSAKNTNDDHEYPIFRATRVEALSAFIWNRYAAATHEVDSSQLQTLKIITNAVSLRNIVMDPPLLSKSSFGNLYTTTAVAMNSRDNVGPQPHESKLVRLMRAANNKINEGYVKRLREGEGNSSVIRELLAKSYPKGQQIVRLSFSSWCWMPVYDADFGWGKPVRVSFTELTLKNSVTFMDTRDGNGIEASINLDEQDMAKLETDEEFLSYVSPTQHTPK